MGYESNLVDQDQNFLSEMEENRKFQCIALSKGMFYLVKRLFLFGVFVFIKLHICVFIGWVVR